MKTINRLRDLSLYISVLFIFISLTASAEDFPDAFSPYNRQNNFQLPQDEVLNTKGKVKPTYKPVVKAFNGIDKKTVAQRKHDVQNSMGDSTEWADLPLVISGKEFDHVSKGLKQLRKAVKYALTHVDQLLTDGVITQEQLDESEGWGEAPLGVNEPGNRFDFHIRPDLVRGADGNWAILELNQGYIGGIGDVDILRKRKKAANPDIYNELKPRPTENFLRDMARLLKKQAKTLKGRRNGKKPLAVYFGGGDDKEMVDTPWGDLPYDMENDRMGKELEKHGIVYVSNHTKQKLKEINGKVYLVENGKPNKLVDVIFDYRTMLHNRFAKSIRNNNLYLFPTPGSAVFESKMFLPALEKVIRNYLHEKPVFHFPQTIQLADANGKINEKAFKDVFKNIRKYVLKESEGAQGDGILIGASATKKEIADFKKQVRRNPVLWQAQEYMEGSTLGGLKTDFNPFLVSIGRSILIPPSALARTAKKTEKFGDDPKFRDVLVIDSDVKKARKKIAKRKQTKKKNQIKKRTRKTNKKKIIKTNRVKTRVRARNAKL